MTKYFVISDNHGELEPMRELMHRFRHQVDYFIHCGDSEFDDRDEVFEQVLAVRGNTDFHGAFPLEIVKDSIYVAHGHQLGVRLNVEELSQRAREMNCSIACYGHTHILNVTEMNGVICINPGSISLPKGPYSSLKTFCIVDVTPQHVQIDYYNDEGIKIDGLTRHINR
ncbi:YfcE family phosphodiesterase [Atopobacter phocae]|uniref:YfcE family phosphodiesterase n=1 Tax=Atopobacter phocae TaxID=136492 RepID=UPI00047129A9|nr:metallophosphoesterase [Atopobacter phocae]